MRIAKYIDPAVFYDKNVSNPYIMSPYLASVNTLSAWPAPHRSHDAVLALENGNAQVDSDDEHVEDEVPREAVEHHQKSTPAKPIRYWSFQGFREDDSTNTLQRKPTRESLRQEMMASPVEEHNTREGSIKSQSTKYDDDRLLTAENPNHRLALTRLGSYGRGPGVQRTSVLGESPRLRGFPEIASDEEEDDDDNQSYYTAVEYIFENEVQADGSIKPVQKKKGGLSVKKVRKSLHIPSAKTVQKNMRGLSIKRKDRNEKRTESASTEVMSPADSRTSSEIVPTRKSIDLMRPFRFGHHDKESSSRKSLQLDREAGNHSPQGRKSTSYGRTSSIRPQAADVEARTPAVVEGLAKRTRPDTIDAQAQSGGSHTTLETATDRKSADDDVQPALASRQDIRPNISTPVTNVGTGQLTRNSTLRTDSSSANPVNSQDRLQARDSIRSEPYSHAAPEAPEPSEDGLSHALDRELGPWRFSNPSIEPIEDTAFIFGDTSHSVKDRRKHFAKSEENRRLFVFDTDIVYCMSFFLPYMNFNTFDIKLGPLGANLHKYVDDQPIRYMARSAERPDEVYFMIEFNLE